MYVISRSLFCIVLCCWRMIFAVKLLPDFDLKKSDYEFKKVPMSNMLKERLAQVDKDWTKTPDVNDTVFGHMLQNHFPMDYIYEDQECVAIYEDPPQAPVHVLIIPRKGLRFLQDANESDKALLGHLLLTANKVALDLGLNDGYRVVINNGKDAHQLIKHLQVHVMGGRQLGWP
ncbi:histidine triad nucleotide-binding protein 1-like [Planococcus citri]|uniref:histidine triad nucleotide-binding protein 1-like n=1 Tax=Planococcus citri TaxID=170843 RepID=UPI0031F731E2